MSNCWGLYVSNIKEKRKRFKKILSKLSWSFWKFRAADFMKRDQLKITLTLGWSGVELSNFSDLSWIQLWQNKTETQIASFYCSFRIRSSSIKTIKSHHFKTVNSADPYWNILFITVSSCGRQLFSSLLTKTLCIFWLALWSRSFEFANFSHNNLP